MSTFFLPPSEDEGPEVYEEEVLADRRRREVIASVHESIRQAEQEARRLENPRSRIITFRMPHDLLHRLDAVAEDAACTRGHMIRQIVAEYMWYVEECDVRYRGSMLTAHQSKRR